MCEDHVGRYIGSCKKCEDNLKHSDWHLEVLQGLKKDKMVSKSIDTYINLRFYGYVQVDGDGEVYLTQKGYAAVAKGVCLMGP